MRNISAFVVRSVLLLTFGLSLVSARVAVADIVVPGTANPWLAGMPDGSTAQQGDVAPAESPVLVSGISVTPGSALTFRATGQESNGSCCSLAPDPDGDTGTFTPHSNGAENGISDVNAPIDALMGVFLDNNQPNGTAAPGSLDFNTIGLNYLSLSPALKQVFFIGDGQTNGGQEQQRRPRRSDPVVFGSDGRSGLVEQPRWVQRLRQ